jgi:hypothetical protein
MPGTFSLLMARLRALFHVRTMDDDFGEEPARRAAKVLPNAILNADC